MQAVVLVGGSGGWSMLEADGVLSGVVIAVVVVVVGSGGNVGSGGCGGW